MPQSAIANGTIAPARFIKLDATADGKVLQAGAGDRTIGISQLGTRRSPYISAANEAALVNEPIRYFDQNEECGLEIAATIAPNDRLSPDANGMGIVTAADGDWYGAIALAAGVSGDIIPVKVVYGERSLT